MINIRKSIALKNDDALEKKIPIKRSKEIRVFKKTLLVFTIIFTIYAFTLAFPLVWLFINSLRTKTDFLFYPLKIFSKYSFKNYVFVFSDSGINVGKMFFNSATLIAGEVAANLFFCSCTAYVISKYKFAGRNIIYFIAIVIMFIPTTGSLITKYTFMSDVGLLDKYIGMVLMSSGGFGFNFLILYGFFKNIPWSYAEAAQIDGAKDFGIFFRIMLPQAKSTLFALAIIQGIGVYNDYFQQLIFYPTNLTVAVGIKTLQDTIVSYGYEYTKYFAAVVICTLPIIIVFAAFQKIIISNAVAGGLKG